MVDGDPMRDRIDPRRELRASIEVSEAAEDPQKRLLRQILDRVMVARCPPNHRPHHGRVFLDEACTGVLVPPEALPHQLPLVTVHSGGPFLDETGAGANGFRTPVKPSRTFAVSSR
jgi:hypothetical protein